MPGRRAPGDTRSFSRVVAAVTGVSLDLGGFDLAVPRAVRVLLERGEARREQGADAARLALHPLEIGERVASDPARLGMRLVEHDARLAPCLLLELLRRALGGDE